jgi:hypothetical protein
MADEQATQQELFQQAVTPPPAAEPAPAPEAPAPEAQPEAQPAAAQQPPAEPPGQGIPAWRLKEEIEARRGAEERLRKLEEQMRQHQAQQTPAAQPSFFDDPNRATQELIVRTLQPYAQQTQQQLMAMGQMMANTVHGADVVTKAEEAFLEAMNNRSLDPADYERVVQAPNRYDAAVQWYKNQSVLSTVGADPAAWFEAQLEQRLADPKFQASLLEKVRAGAAAQPGTVKLPPSLSRATAAQPNAGGGSGDGSDASLWSHVMGAKGR